MHGVRGGSRTTPPPPLLVQPLVRPPVPLAMTQWSPCNMQLALAPT